MDLAYTRAMVRAAVDGTLAQAELVPEAAFGLSIPTSCPGVPAHLLDPRNAWADKDAYDETAVDLAERFARNFERFEAPGDVRRAGPAPVAG
jgi:phosphoenolpyruvate carboxykinase (ATP)